MSASVSDPIEIWNRSAEPRNGRKPGHTHESIVRAALQIADTQGLEALSIRKLATSIGAGAASLYRYIRSQDELMELMLDSISGEYCFESDAREQESTPALRLLNLAQQGRAIMKRHPWSASLLLSQPALGPNSLAYLEHALLILRPTKLDASAKLRMVAMLTAITSAYVQNELVTQAGVGRSSYDVVARAKYLEQASTSGRYPELADVLSGNLLPADPDLVFQQIIATYLAGAGIPVA